LRGLADPALVWLFALLALVMPELDRRLMENIADWPLDFFFVLAALGLARWLLTQERWALAWYGVMLAGTFATKREGQLLAACLVVGGLLAAGWARRREGLWLAGVALAAYAVNIPWRIWWSSRHLASDTPPGGILHATGHTERIVPSFKLVLELLFSSSLYLPAVALALAAAVVSLARRDRTVIVLFLVTLGLGIVGFAWVNWSDPTLTLTTEGALNPTSRAVGALVLLSIAMAPLLLTQASREAESSPEDQRRLKTIGSASTSATNA
jgi:hypothetical protein